MSNNLISRGFTGSATSVLTSGFLRTLIRRVGRSSRKVYDVATEKIREYYVSAKNINTSAIFIKINHMKLFLERIFISAGNIIGVRKHKKNLKDYRRKL